MSGRIDRVTVIQQRAIKFYSFPLSAFQLKSLGVISRLHDGEGGVQRGLDDKKATEIALAMADNNVAWLDTFLVHMEPEGSFTYCDGVIEYNDDFRLSIDDGQHRQYGMSILSDEQLERLGEFSVNATHGLVFEQRLALFVQQENRRHINKNLLLKSKNLLGKFDRPIDKTAYDLVVSLATDTRSPLLGKIYFEEVERGQFAGVVPPLLATGMLPIIRSSISNKSILFRLSSEEAADVLIRYLRIASNIWSKQWDDKENYMISASRGIASLLRLFVTSKTLRVYLDNDFSDSQLRSLLLLASTFDWSLEANRNRSDAAILDGLDALMSKKFSQRKINRPRTTSAV
jgi:hypothetical protein